MRVRFEAEDNGPFNRILLKGIWCRKGCKRIIIGLVKFYRLGHLTIEQRSLQATKLKSSEMRPPLKPTLSFSSVMFIQDIFILFAQNLRSNRLLDARRPGPL